MIRLVLLLAATVASPAIAQVSGPRAVETPCVNDGSESSCVRNLACIGTSGRWYDGRAIGWNSGVTRGRTSDGVLCTGTWEVLPSGAGRSEIVCEDGTTAEVISNYQDHPTGTAIGRAGRATARRS